MAHMLFSLLRNRWMISRIVSSILGIAFCLLAISSSAEFGFSRLLARYGLVTKSIPAATQAVRLTPQDAEAHRALAVAFRNIQMYREAAKEFEIAASLRPADDYLWLELGTLRDELNDQTGALSAFDESVRRAPFYAHTRWQRANLRLRMGRYDEAFAELRAAAESNRTLLPNLIDLAWGISREDASLAEQLAGIDSIDEHITYARFLAGKGKGKETREQFMLVAPYFSDEQRRQLVRDLMWAHEYREAFNIWKGAQADSPVVPQIYDGGFEGTIGFDEIGFGWNVSRDLAKVSVSIDASEKDSGAKSLRIAFDGPSSPSIPVVSQTIVVRPGGKYRINFGLRAKDIISGGLPILKVSDAATNAELASSPSFPKSTSQWEKQSIEFTASSAGEAIVLKLVRNECQTQPCPIFGVLWLDSLSIEEIKQ
jgi:tetratricopeptide (TPR) repeat protein